MKTFIAIDLGASNGRVMKGCLEKDILTIEEMHRFEHSMKNTDSRLFWDWDLIMKNIYRGLSSLAIKNADGTAITSISCSSWAQDFGLLDEQGELFYAPRSYRDPRTKGMPGSLSDIIQIQDLLSRTGAGALPVTTLCQLRAMSLQEPGKLEKAAALLFIADLVHYALCGKAETDRTFATVSQIFSLETEIWDTDLLDMLGIPSHSLPPIAGAPKILGSTISSEKIGPALDGVPVVVCAGHDTAAASSCAWSKDQDKLFLSLGTWAMMGCCIGDEALFTDKIAETGCVLMGIPDNKWAVFCPETGLWPLQECQRQWVRDGSSMEYEQLAGQASHASIETVIDLSDSRFHAPRNMTDEIRTACREAGVKKPETPGEFTKVILDSIALCLKKDVERLHVLTGRIFTSIQVTSGGSRNTYLCRKLADALGMTVKAGPAEATAIGNMINQSLAMGTLSSWKEAARVLDNSFPCIIYEPDNG